MDDQKIVGNYCPECRKSISMARIQVYHHFFTHLKDELNLELEKIKEQAGKDEFIRKGIDGSLLEQVNVLNEKVDRLLKEEA